MAPVLLNYPIILYPDWENQTRERERIARETRKRMSGLRQGYFSHRKIRVNARKMIVHSPEILRTRDIS